MKSISELELLNQFREHQKWVQSLGKNGRKLSLDEIDLRRISLDAEVFEQGYLAACKFDGIVFKGTSFYLSKLFSSSFKGCSFDEVDFTKAELSYTDFSYSKFLKANFTKVECFEADFRNSEFTNITMGGSGFYKTDFRNCKLSDIDLSYSYFDQILVNGLSITKFIGLELISSICLNIGDLEQPILLKNEEAKQWLLNNTNMNNS